MSGFFDELERRLRAGTTDQYAGSKDARRSPARATFARRHRRLLLAAVVSLVGLSVPALAAVSDLWQPDVRPGPSMHSVTVRGTSFGCNSTSSRSFDTGPPIGPEFTSVLAVLARPRSARDALDRRYLRAPFARGIDAKSIRYLGTAPGGSRYYVVPAAGSGEAPPPKECLQRLPPKLRKAYEQPARQEPTICLVGGGTGACGSLADVRRRGSWGASGIGGRSTVAGVVPNGVQAIQVTYGRSTRTFPVSDNFFAFRVALEVPQAVQVDRMVWKLDDGSTRDVIHRHAAPLRRSR